MRTCHFALILILAVFSSSLLGQVPRTATDSKPTVTGRLETVEGMKVLTLWGTLDERSFAEGYLMAEAIDDLVDHFMLSRRVSFGAPKAWDLAVRPAVLGRFRFSDDDRIHARAVVAGMKARDPASIHIEALGRDLEPKDLLVASCIPDMVGLLCSSFVAWGKETRGDALLFGRNLDYFATEALTRRTMIIVRAPRGKRRGWVSLGWPGIRGCVTGFSDAGVGLAIHDVMVKGKKERGERFTSRILALQELIETLDAGPKIRSTAVKRLDALRFALGGNGMLAWARNDALGAVVLEFDSRKGRETSCTDRAAAKGEPFVLCSNHHRVRSEKGHGCRRYARIRSFLETAGQPMDFAAGWKAISEGTVRGTLYRVLADLRSGRMEVDRRLQPRGPFAPRVHVNLHRLLERAHP